MAYGSHARPTSYHELVSESRALLHEAKAEAIRERESVTSLEAKRRELARALDRTAEQRATTRLARQAARDMSYRVEATKQSAQQRRAEIRHKRLEDYQRELREIHEERRRREADSERWWTDKLLGVLEEQVDSSCDDMARVRSEITRTRDMLNREAENAKLKAALGARTTSTGHIHHHHYPPKPPASAPPKRPLSAFAKYLKADSSTHTPRTHVHNHTHVHVNGGEKLRRDLFSSETIQKHAHTYANGSATQKHTHAYANGGVPVYGSCSSRGESDNESDTLSAEDDSDSSDDEQVDFVRTLSRPASARPSVKDILAKDKAARNSDSETASQLGETLAERRDVMRREQEKSAKLDEENERKNRSHCSHLVRAIKHTNAEIKGIRSDQHRVLAKERARSRKLERQLKRLEVSYKRIQAARPRHSWVPSGYGTS